MQNPLYEVVYVDKFDDQQNAELFRQRLGERFGLNREHMRRMCSGMPIVVKKRVGFEEAERYRSAIRKVGGICWVQALDADGKHQERRRGKRRGLLDRRGTYRASSILPDRRGMCGRRSTDG
ncbi:MAG: hypothetical protein WDZ30_02430 [Cellvibrionaceae bacterium]